MQRKELKGITVDGVPLQSYLDDKPDYEVGKEVRDIIKASKRNSSCIYFSPKKGRPKEERGHGPVTNIPNIEIHRKNCDSYVKQMMQSNNIRGAIVGVLLSSDKPLTAFQIKNIINKQIESDPVKSAQIRVHLGYIMKSHLASAIMKEYTEGRSRGAVYCMKDMDRESYNLEGAAFHASQIVKKDKDQKKETPPGGDKLEHKSNIEFILTDKNELPVLKVEGAIDVNVNIHFTFGR